MDSGCGVEPLRRPDAGTARPFQFHLMDSVGCCGVLYGFFPAFQFHLMDSRRVRTRRPAKAPRAFNSI